MFVTTAGVAVARAMQVDAHNATAQARFPHCEPIIRYSGDGAPDPKMFIELGEKPKTVHLTVIAAYNMDNGGMNFNGYSRGGATYRVPEGWKVTVTFKNNSAVPHSALVIDGEDTDRLQLDEPWFDGATTKSPKRGGTSTESFTFTPDEQGSFAIACGFPGHCVGGHWLKLIVGKPDSTPSLKLGDMDAYTPAK